MDEFRLLGPLDAVVAGRRISLGAEKPRALLALLLLNRNRVVSTERLIDELWGDAAPRRATKTLQVYVSQLRKELGVERLATRPPGYVLHVAHGELDLDRFESLVAAAREHLEAGEADDAAAELRDALALWRGPALQEFRAEPFAQAAAGRLEDQRLAAVEDRVHAELEGGAAAALVPELEELVASHPLRDRPRELLMLALYRAGRQADALDLYRQTRELYVGELGIEPGPALQELERAVLRQDPGLASAAPRRSYAGPAEVPAARSSRLTLAAAAALAVAALALGAVVGLTSIRDGSAGDQDADPELRAFVTKVENFLVQAHTGRQDVKQAVAGALECDLSAREAASRLEGVQRNRQSLLQQLAALRVPAGEPALTAADLLQKASRASIEADWRYRDWLETRTRCTRLGRPPAVARAADARATALKRRFLTAFDPLARRYGGRIWQADEF